MLDLLLHVDKHLATLVASAGPWTYVLLFGVIFAETGLVILPFLPGDSLLFAAGALAATGLPMILVALRNPYDLRNMPDHVAALAGWEYTRPLFDALWPVLNGTARPTGKLPLLTLTKAAE